MRFLHRLLLCLSLINASVISPALAFLHPHGGASLALLSATDSDYAQETRNTEDLLWWTASDEGHSLEEVIHTKLISGEPLTLTARDGVVVDYHETGTLEGSIAQLSNVEGLSWMADLQNRDDVNWQAVSAKQEEWDYEDQGLTEVGAAVVGLAVAAATGGTGGLASGFANSAAGAMGLGGNAVATAAMEAGFTTLTQQASIALINNQGDIAAALEDLGSQNIVLQLASSMATAGLTTGALDMAGIPGVSPEMSFDQNLINGVQSNLIEATVRVGVETVIEGRSLGEATVNALRLAAADTVGAAVATEIGTAAKLGEIDTAAQMIAHAALGCATGAIASGDCAGGAAGGVAGEVVAQAMLAGWVEDELNRLQSLDDGEWTQADFDAQVAQVSAEFAALKARGVDVAALAGGMTAAIAGGNVNTGAMTGGNAAQHNAFAEMGAAAGCVATVEIGCLPGAAAGGAAGTAIDIAIFVLAAAGVVVVADAVLNESDEDSEAGGASGGVQIADTAGTPDGPDWEPEDEERNQKDTTFGRNPNQEYHTWRHIDEIGLDRTSVRNAILDDLPSDLAVGSHRRRIIVNGIQLEYRLFKFADGSTNIGTIFDP